MIKIKKKLGTDAPAILLTKGVEASKALEKRLKQGETEFESKDFDGGIYGSKEVKDSLKVLQDYKCCFCEAKIGHTSHGDVEHFRPKTGWVQDNEKLNKPGYYWLAYDWDNLFLSCELCNQRYKKNFFPLLPASFRAVSHTDDYKTEQPVFIHPVNDNPEDFILFNEEIPIAVNENTRGKATIAKLGLDRDLLNEHRRKTFNKMKDIYDLAKGYPDILPELKRNAKAIIEGYYNDSQLDSTEYASMLRCFFTKNPIDF